MQLSNTTLRKITYSSGAESMFYLIDDTKKCSDIEFQSENWKRYPNTGNSQYWIFEQFDAKDKPRGIIRIIKKSMAQARVFGIKVDVNPRYCTYYAKRNAPI